MPSDNGELRSPVS